MMVMVIVVSVNGDCARADVDDYDDDYLDDDGYGDDTDDADMMMVVRTTTTTTMGMMMTTKHEMLPRRHGDANKMVMVMTIRTMMTPPPSTQGEL